MILDPFKRKSIEEILLDQGKLTSEQLDYAKKEKEESGDDIAEVLIRLGMVKKDEVFEAVAHQKGVNYINLSEARADETLRKYLPEQLMRRFKAVPVKKEGESILVAMTDPMNMIAIEEMERASKLRVNPALSSQEAIEKHQEKIYGGFTGLSDLTESVEVEIKPEDSEISEIEDDEYDAEDKPIIKYVNSVISEAVRKNATDIHLEPMEEDVLLRLRIDGELREFSGPAKKAYSAIISRVKILADLDIAERRLPQDGKVRAVIEGEKVNLRVSTLPTVFGEKIVMRILQMSGIFLDLETLGFSDRDLNAYKEALNAPLGMILVTGPTGSGKTTTLYSGLSLINVPEKNITTVEDPIEYQLRRINQVQVKADIDLTFASFLRSVLRQDPDVIMVGEIRDRETAEIAIQSALTGHLVLSTLHTNDAVSTLTRLRYMGIETFLIADAVNLVMAQRLVRRICPECKKEADVSDAVLRKIGLDPAKVEKVYEGEGCEKCFGSGYKGRTAVYEVLRITEEIERMIVEDATDMQIRQEALKDGMVTIKNATKMKMLQGHTTVDEVLTVTL